MSFTIRPMTQDPNAGWFVGYSQGGPDKDGNISYAVESNHPNRMAAAAWCSYLNGGDHPEIANAKVISIKSQAQSEVSRIIGNIRA